MCAYRPRGGHGHHPYSRADSRDNFYDERRSPSPSAAPHRHSPPHDIPRGPSQRFANDDEYNGGGRGGQSGYRDHSRDRRDYSNRRDGSAPRRRDGRYVDWDRERRSRSRSRSRSQDSYDDRPSSRGQPSKEIMMEGLASHLTENHITAELKQHYNVAELDDVRIIRDRQTKQSRAFGFLRFHTIEESTSFMDANYPSIYLYGRSTDTHASDGAKVRIAYGKERKEPRTEEGDWICSICKINNFATRVLCFRCQAPPPDPATVQKPSNVGDNDAAPDNTPSQFLLLRGLEPSVSVELFAKGVAKLNKPSATQAQSLVQQNKKSSKVASTTGDANLGAREGSLRRVLLVRSRRTNESWRYGFAEYASVDDAQAALTRYNSFDRFTIASKEITVSYIHAGVFVPVLNPTPTSEQFTFSPLGNPAMRLAYWDEEAYVTEFVVSAPAQPLDGDQTSTSRIPDLNGVKPSKDTEKSRKRKVNDVAPASTKKVTPSHLQFWSNRHAELHGIKTKNEGSNQLHNTDSIPPSKSYADPERHCCYLCMRQFQNQTEVNKHERLSKLHRDNLKDASRVSRAEHKLEKHNISQSSTDYSAESQQQTNEYRDRARERRKIYGVVNKKGETVGGSSAAKRNTKDEDDLEPSAPVQSKGAALLGKMGYKAGQGLGASGEGMKAPLTQDVYVAGVGLGAVGGKLGDAVEQAEQNTKGDYSVFAQQTRDRARERYRDMDK